MEKKRCNNFISSEVDLLVSLVEEFKDIVECKKTDTVTNNIKEAEWQKIESRFNAISGTARTAKMLRSKWDSLKKSTKKEFAEHKQSLYKTGGGPGSSGVLDIIGNRVLAIIGVGATGTTSRFDSDCDIPVTEAISIAQETESTVSVTAIELDKDDLHEDITTEEIHGPSCSWKNWNPQQWRQPKTKALQISEDKAVCVTVNDEIIVQKDELRNGTPVTLETKPQCSSNNKRKRFYKSEPIPSKIKSKKTRYEQLQEELVLKKMALIDMQIKVVEEEREEKRALFELQKEEAIQRTKQIAEKHELEIKVLLANLQGEKKL